MAYTEPKNRGFHDADHDFATEQAIPTDGADDISENVLDFQNAAPRIGAGEKAMLRVQITTLVAVASGTPTMNINLVTASSAALCTASATVVISALLTLGYNDAKGEVYSAALPGKPVTAYQRFVGLVLEPVSDSTLYTAGAIDAWLDFD